MSSVQYGSQQQSCSVCSKGYNSLAKQVKGIGDEISHDGVMKEKSVSEKHLKYLMTTSENDLWIMDSSAQCTSDLQERITAG